MLKKLFGRKKNDNSKNNDVEIIEEDVVEVDETEDGENVAQMYAENLGEDYTRAIISMEIVQNRLEEHVTRKRDWFIDFGESKFSLGEEEFDFQYIGCDLSWYGIWAWGWQNIVEVDCDTLSMVNNLREKYDYELFKETNPSLTEEFNSQNYAKIACYLSDKDYFYYKIPLDNGYNIFIAIENNLEVLKKPVDAYEFLFIMAYLCTSPAMTYVDHELAVEVVAQHNNSTIEKNGNFWEIEVEGATMVVEFEDNKVKDVVEK